MSKKNTLASNSFRVLSLASAVGLITACGGTGQDNGTASTFEQTFSGVAIDGHLARATVFLDTNNDGTRNPWEPFAFTDDEGYYSYNPNTGRDYCASNATPQEAQYCLRTSVEHSEVVVRVDSGYDILTGEPFVGQMSRRLTNLNDTPVTDTVVSPISSLLTNVRNETDQNSVLSSLGLESDDLDVDYYNTDGSGAINSGLLNTAVKVHKVVSLLSDRITDTYDEIGSESGTPNDATSAVYSELANQLLNSGSNLDTTLSDRTAMASVLDSAEEQMRAVYERKEFDLPADMGSTSSPENFNRVIDVSNNIVNIVNSVINPTATLNQSDVIGRTRAIESVVIKGLEETSDDTTIENATNFFTNTDNSDLVSSLLSTLASDTADISTLSTNDFTGDDFDSEEEINQVARLPVDALPFTQIGGMQLRVSDLDLGYAPDELDDSEVEFYFNGDATDLSGMFQACVKHIDGANIDGTLGEGSTRGELVDGYWSLLGATDSSMQSYSLLITIDFLGATYQAILKPAGSETIDNVEYKRIRFDNDGEVRAWHSLNGMTASGSIPTTDEECAEMLPSRIGI